MTDILILETRPKRLSTEMVKVFEKTYDTGVRQLRRWWSEGAPLHDPRLMINWWSKNKTWELPVKIRTAATLAEAEHGPAAPQDISSDKNIECALPVLDITSSDLEEGETVKQQRQLVKALYGLLREAYAQNFNVDAAQARYLKATEALRKLEASDREARKMSGQLVSISTMRKDVGTAVELLKRMQESMVRRVLELCPELTTAQKKAVGEAIESVREQERLILYNIKTLNNADNVGN